jgi:hypothetical protein
MTATDTSVPTAAAPLRMTGGRLAALVIGVPVCLALIATTALSLVADLGIGHYPVNYAIPAGARSVNVTLDGGQLAVKQTAANQATLTGTATYSLVRSKLTASTAGGKTVIGYRCPMPFGDCDLDTTLNAPAGMPVSANTAGGNARVTGTTGEVTLTTRGGDVVADHTSGPLTMHTGGGNIKATAITSRSLSATTDGGDINATGIDSPIVTATTKGGNIEIGFTSVPQNVSVDTSGGNITLILPPGSTRYNVSASTAGGSVNDSLTRGTSNNTISATSAAGNITLRYAN